MKRILLLLSLVTIAGCTNAQKTDAKNGDSAKTAAVKVAETPDKPQPIPPFRILTTDSVYFTPANLVKGKPVVIIYFSPDCSHCQHMMYELKPDFAKLKKAQIVMVTWSNKYDIRGIREFKRDYDLVKYPNFTLGTEGYTMLVQKYYDVKTTPFVAIYDSKGKYFKYFSKPPKTADLLAAILKVK